MKAIAGCCVTALVDVVSVWWQCIVVPCVWCSCVVARNVRSPSWMLKSQQLQFRERDRFLRPGVLLRTRVRLAIRPQVLYHQRHPQNRFYGHWYLCVGSLRKESCTPCRAAFALVLWLKTGGLAGFALGSNKTANSSNTTVYVGVTIFALCGLVGVLVGFEATGFLSATGIGHMIAVASSTFLYSTRTVYVGVTVFALCGPVGVLVGFGATKFLSATGVGLLIAVASGTFLCCALPDLLLPALQLHGTVSMT